VNGTRSGVLLSGGRSSRMRTPKGLLELGGAPLLTRVARPLCSSCDQLILSVSVEEYAPASFVAELTAALERAGGRRVTVVRDGQAHQGPIAGVAAALRAARGNLAFVTGCDSPFLARSLVEGLFACAEAAPDIDVVLPVRGERAEPLLAVYRVATMASHFESRLAAGGGRMTDGFADVNVLRVTGEKLRLLDPTGASFLNVNDPDDYRRACAHLGARSASQL